MTEAMVCVALQGGAVALWWSGLALLAWCAWKRRWEIEDRFIDAIALAGRVLQWWRERRRSEATTPSLQTQPKETCRRCGKSELCVPPPPGGMGWSGPPGWSFGASVDDTRCPACVELERREARSEALGRRGAWVARVPVPVKRGVKLDLRIDASKFNRELRKAISNLEANDACSLPNQVTVERQPQVVRFVPDRCGVCPSFRPELPSIAGSWCVEREHSTERDSPSCYSQGAPIFKRQRVTRAPDDVHPGLPSGE